MSATNLQASRPACYIQLTDRRISWLISVPFPAFGRVRRVHLKSTGNRGLSILLSMSSIQKLVEEASRLPHDQQLTLANRVLELSEAGVADDAEDTWDSELRARVQAYDAGRSRTRSARDVFERLDSKL